MAPVSRQKVILAEGVGPYLCAPYSCSSRITSAEDRFWDVPPLDWARASSAAAGGAIAVEMFLPLAGRDEPLSLGWKATGAMLLVRNSR